MRTIVLISHGKMAHGVKSSLEMIIGKQEGIYALSLNEDEDNIKFEEKLKEQMKAFSGEVTIIADLLGGTPCNVAVKNYIDDANITIIAGLSLPLVIECATNPTLTTKELVASARAGVLDVKSALNKVENEEEPTTPEKDYSDYADKSVIVNVRIDERLIHGQVAGIWTTSLDTQRIIVANDEAAANPLQKSSLRLAAPSTMRLSVLPVKEAAKNINAGKYGKQRIFLLFKTPQDALEFVQAGGKLDTLNVGNMSYKEGAREVTKNIKVMPDEEEMFLTLAKKGVTITAQLVPNDPSIDFIKKLTNK